MHPIRLVATYLLFLSFSICTVAIIYPSLFRHETPNHVYSLGWFNECNCTWYSEAIPAGPNQKFEQFMLEGWLHWLYIGAVSVMNICLFSWFILSFFGKPVHYISMTVIGVFMLIGAGLVAAAVILFGIQTNKQLGFGISDFGYSLWVAVGGFALSFLTGVVLIAIGPSLYRSHKNSKHRRR